MENRKEMPAQAGRSVVLYPVSLADVSAARSCAEELVAKGITVYVMNITGSAELDAGAAAATAREKGSRYIGVFTDKLPSGEDGGSVREQEPLRGAAPVYYFVSGKQGGRDIYSVSSAGVFALSEDVTAYTLAEGLQPYLKIFEPPHVPDKTPVYGPGTGSGQPPAPDNASKGIMITVIAVLLVILIPVTLMSCMGKCGGPEIIPHESIDTSGFQFQQQDDGSSALWGSLMDTPSDNMGYDDEGLTEDRVEGDYVYAQCISGEYKGLAYIERYTGSESELTLPETLGGIKVISVSAYAFKENNTLKKVTIPEGYVNISVDAFSKCKALQSVRLPESMRTIDQSAFYECIFLKDINFPAGLREIGSFAFYRCPALEGELVLPEGLAVLGSNAFSECIGIKSISLPDSLEEAGSNAFNGCITLNKVSTGDGLESVSEYMFAKCDSLREVSFGKNVSVIGKGAFMQSGLESIRLPETVKTVGDGTFMRCEKLVSVSLPASLDGVTGAAFKECTAIRGYEVYSVGDKLRTDGGILFSGDGQKLIAYPASRAGAYTVPDGVTGISEYAFDRAGGLDSVILPDTLRDIGQHAFRGTGISEINIPDSVTEIEDYVFSGCENLQKAHIGAGTQSVGTCIFYGCERLGEITAAPGGCRVENGMLIENGSQRVVNAVRGLSGELVIPDGVRTIGGNCFREYGEITSVVFPESMESIDFCAFTDCAALENITFGGKEKEIGSDAFRNCVSLREVILPECVEDLSNGVFKDCTALGRIHLGKSVSKLHSGVLCGCTSLENVEIPNSVTEIVMAFEDCTALNSVVIPDSVVEIRSGFERCTSLERVVMSDRIVKLDTDTFRGCENLREMYFPNTHEFYIAYIRECPNLERIYYGGTKMEWQAYLRSDPNNPVMPEGVEIIYGCEKPSK